MRPLPQAPPREQGGETENAEQVATKPVKVIGALADLPALETIINIEMNDGTFQFKGKRLTYAEFNRIGRLVPSPEPPIRGVDSLKRPIYNENDSTYQREMGATNDRRLYLRLAAFLQIDIPAAETLEQRADMLEKTLEMGLVRALSNTMSTLVFEGKVNVSARAATFHADGAGGAADLPADGLDA